MEEMKPYHFIIPKGFSLYKNSSIIYQTHVYIYADELDYEQTLENAERVKTIFPRISAELDIFITWLEQQVSD